MCHFHIASEQHAQLSIYHCHQDLLLCFYTLHEVILHISSCIHMNLHTAERFLECHSGSSSEWVWIFNWFLFCNSDFRSKNLLLLAQLLFSEGSSNWLVIASLREYLNFEESGVTLFPPLPLITENKFSKQSWVNRLVNKYEKPYWLWSSCHNNFSLGLIVTSQSANTLLHRKNRKTNQ